MTFRSGTCLASATVIFTLRVALASLNFDSLIATADIYYQRPLTLGPPIEEPLHQIDNLTMMDDLKVIIHGFTGSRQHISIKPLANAYLAAGFTQVFLADWEDAAGLDYPNSRKAVARVASHFGKLLEDFMIRLEIEPSTVHIIGHSLGAHIAGDVGKYFNGTLGRITGLDPALPLFTPYAVDSLQSSDGQFVDVIHTDYPVFGDLTPRGIVDFYPNFGHSPQNGCETINFLSVSKLIFEAYSCSHNRAVLLYAESIGLPGNFPTLPCSLNGIKQRNLEICLNSSLTKASGELNEVVFMGESVTKSANGFYYLDTYETPPYGKGEYTKFP